MSDDRPSVYEYIGPWSEVKLDILREYASAYSTILSAKENLSHVYVDAFAGAGAHVSRRSGQFVPGSPLNALEIKPPFTEYYLIDIDAQKVDELRRVVGQRNDVHIFQGDCNRILLSDVFPRIRYNQFRRGLCLLDPYGVHLEWQVIESAGRLGTIDMFLNFPIMDMNRNVLWRDPSGVSEEDAARMTRFWGDESWKAAAYRQQPTIFGDTVDLKLGNRDVVEAFTVRLRDVAGFARVSDPLPMRNANGAVVYYLIFASQRDVALNIVGDIFAKYRRWGV